MRALVFTTLLLALALAGALVGSTRLDMTYSKVVRVDIIWQSTGGGCNIYLENGYTESPTDKTKCNTTQPGDLYYHSVHPEGVWLFGIGLILTLISAPFAIYEWAEAWREYDRWRPKPKGK